MALKINRTPILNTQTASTAFLASLAGNVTKTDPAHVRKSVLISREIIILFKNR